MEKQLQELLENEVLGPEARQALQEAFATKLKEAETKLQESYAQRFEHERATLVEAMDTMLNDVVRKELGEFAQDKRAVATKKVELTKAVSEAKSQYNRKLAQHVKMMEQFMQTSIRKEIAEFQKDRRQLTVQRDAMAKELLETQKRTQAALATKVAKLENFVLKQLSEEITEFQADKKALVEQRVKLASTAKRKLEETQSKFVNRAATVVDKTLNEVIKRELVQWRDDIKIARENNFGRKIFEAVAAEFMTSYLAEGTQVKKLTTELTQQRAALAEAQKQISAKQTLVETERASARAAQAQLQRAETLNELLSPLARDKKKIMESLLSDVRTPNLKESFHRYLPAVLNQTAPAASKPAPAPQRKAVAHSGDRVSLVETQQNPTEDRDLQNILYLAGIAKAQ
jgi:hypothetical protein